jgi:hypothetical protein
MHNFCTRAGKSPAIKAITGALELAEYMSEVLLPDSQFSSVKFTSVSTNAR